MFAYFSMSIASCIIGSLCKDSKGPGAQGQRPLGQNYNVSWRRLLLLSHLDGGLYSDSLLSIEHYGISSLLMAPNPQQVSGPTANMPTPSSQPSSWEFGRAQTRAQLCDVSETFKWCNRLPWLCSQYPELCDWQHTLAIHTCIFATYACVFAGCTQNFAVRSCLGTNCKLQTANRVLVYSKFE